MFIVPLQWQSYRAGSSIARAMSAQFKAFSFPVIKSYSVVPVFRSSVIPRFPVSPLTVGECLKRDYVRTKFRQNP